MHEALDPEYSILKQRLARRIRHDGLTDEDIAKMDLVQITKVQSPVACYLLQPAGPKLLPLLFQSSALLQGDKVLSRPYLSVILHRMPWWSSRMGLFIADCGADYSG